MIMMMIMINMIMQTGVKVHLKLFYKQLQVRGDYLQCFGVLKFNLKNLKLLQQFTPNTELLVEQFIYLLKRKACFKILRVAFSYSASFDHKDNIIVQFTIHLIIVAIGVRCSTCGCSRPLNFAYLAIIIIIMIM